MKTGKRIGLHNKNELTKLLHLDVVLSTELESSFDDTDSYNSRVFNRVVNLYSVKNRLLRIENIISNSKILSNSIEMSMEKFVELQWSLYVVYINSYYDIILLLVNDVFSFGLNENCVNDKTIVENNNIDNKLRNELKTLFHLISNENRFRVAKNKVAHQGIIDNHELMNSAWIQENIFKGKILGFSFKDLFVEHSQILEKKSFKKNLDELKSKRIKLESKINEILDILAPEFKSKNI